MNITCSATAFEKLRSQMVSEVEEFWVMGLRSDKTVIDCKCLFRGTVDACLVHLRDIFRFACRVNAAAILVAHNHPSFDATPSADDLRFTRRLIKASLLLQIPVVDHLIIAKNSYLSLADMGYFAKIRS